MVKVNIYAFLIHIHSSFVEFFNFLLKKKKVTKCVTWDMNNVVNSIVSSIEIINPPLQVIVGTDGKYLLMLKRMLPVWFLDRVAPYCVAAGLKND